MKLELLLLATLILATSVLYNLNFHAGQERYAKVRAVSIYEQCRNNKDLLSCYEKALSLLTGRTNLSFSYKVLLAIKDLDPTARTCHGMAHKMASAEVEKDPRKWRDVLKMADLEDCSIGFFHGTMETVQRFDPQLKVAGLDKLCSEENMLNPGFCAHTYGHLLLVEAYGDLDKAIEECERTSFELAVKCYSGVFMENMTRAALQSHGLAKAPAWNENFMSKIEEACSQYSDQRSRICWGEMGHLYATVGRNDPKMAFDMCGKAREEGSADNCYLGALARIVAASSDAAYINNVCSYYESGKNYTWCVHKAVEAMLNASPDNKERAAIFCSKSKTPDECSTYIMN